MMYLDYHLALTINEEARQKAAIERLLKAHRVGALSRFKQAFQNLTAKTVLQRKGKYGLQ
jgi:hypothetical protein